MIRKTAGYLPLACFGIWTYRVECGYVVIDSRDSDIR